MKRETLNSIVTGAALFPIVVAAGIWITMLMPKAEAQSSIREGIGRQVPGKCPLTPLVAVSQDRDTVDLWTRAGRTYYTIHAEADGSGVIEVRRRGDDGFEPVFVEIEADGP